MHRATSRVSALLSLRFIGMLCLATAMAVAMAMAPSVSVSISAQGPTIPVTTHVTADNHYALYYGDDAGANLTFVGRNEPGGLMWSSQQFSQFL